MSSGKQYQEARIIDLILNRFSPKEDPSNRVLENLPEPQFKMMVDVLKKDEARYWDDDKLSRH